jgi:hypothetical protein
MNYEVSRENAHEGEQVCADGLAGTLSATA